MNTYSFTIVLADVDEVVADATQQKFLELSEALFQAGCDDGSPGVSGGIVFIDFDREAQSLRDAIESALADVERTGYRVAAVQPSERKTFDDINAELAHRAS